MGTTMVKAPGQAQSRRSTMGLPPYQIKGGGMEFAADIPEPYWRNEGHATHGQEQEPQHQANMQEG